MNAEEFLGALKANDHLELVSVDAEAAYVRNSKRDSVWRIEPRAILEYTWKEVSGVLLGTREPRLLHHMARVVGYYSNVAAWNKSKIAELLDRCKGDYGIG